MKRIQPNWLARLRRASKPAGGTLAGTTGSAGTVLGIATSFGYVVPASLLYWTIGWCIVPPLAVLAWNSKSRHLPDVIVDDENPDRSYDFRYCTAADLKEANSWTKAYYRHEYVSDEVAESWRTKAPRSFVAIYNAQVELCAAFGIIGIESSFMKQFVKGRIKDNTLTPDDLLDDAAARKSPDLYISGVVVKDPDSAIGHKRACAMVWGMAKFVERRYGVRKKRTLFALAVSKTSRNSLKKAGFQHHSGPKGREDDLELYSFEVTRHRLTEIMKRIGDYSGQCKLGFDSDKRSSEGNPGRAHRTG